MTLLSVTARGARERAARGLLLLASVVLALVSPRPYANWNSGSRLAAVESLVDYRTWEIDRSVFAKPLRVDAFAPSPYEPCSRRTRLTHLQKLPVDSKLMYAGYLRTSIAGTGDKMLIGSHYYSDKSPLPSLLMAGVYSVIQSASGLTARSRADVFIYSMTLISSGLPYFAAVAAVSALAVRLLGARGLLLAASFTFATAAPSFTRDVNIHIVLLASAAALFLGLNAFRERLRQGHRPWLVAGALGTLGGFAYGTDMGAGPVLFVTLLPLVAYRCFSGEKSDVRLFLIFLLAAAPWIAAHHVLNFRIGGTFWPASASLQNFQWPDSPWTSDNLTGSWKHPNLQSAVKSAMGFLFGFLLHNPTLLLALAGFVLLLRDRRKVDEMPELIFAAAWSAGTWLLYSSASRTGQIGFARWFLPMLAPGYYVLAILLRERPKLWREFLILSGGGAVIAANLWRWGPWIRIVPNIRTALATALLVWIFLWLSNRIPPPSLTSERT